MNDAERELIRNRLLGWGVAVAPTMPGLDVGVDVVLADGPAGRDLATVSGLDNLVQDLSLALTTLLGSDPFNTSFGFDGLNALVEESNPVMVRERVRVAVIQVLRKDPRVRAILDVDFDNARMTVPQAGLRELEVRVSFETVSGDQISAEIGRVIVNA